jgi:translation elongation factor aEF-1 beta
MGKAMVVFKIFPESPEAVDLVEKGVKEIKEGEVKDVRKEPLAFGMSIIRAGILIPDKEEGRMEKLEKAVKNIKGVKEVEVEGITLI